MKSLTRLALTGLLFTATPAFAAPASPALCESFTKTTIAKVMDILHDKKQTEVQKKGNLSTVFNQALDLDWVGKFVAGRFWKSASAEEQQSFLQHYRKYLTTLYISKFDNDEGMGVNSIQLVSISPAEENEFSAKTVIHQDGEADVSVNYLLNDETGTCRVHDITVEGVSLLVTQRSEFQTMAASKGGLKGLIAAMEKQIASINQ